MLPLFFMQSSDSINYQFFTDGIRSQLWVTPGKRVLVACSGGLDSVFLLHLLYQIPELTLGVIHLNHGLRGKKSDEDARFVQKLSESLNLPCFSRKINLHLDPQLPKIGLEATARKLRYEYFNSVRVTEKYDVITTAHTGSDFIETVLLNLLRGTGISGLRGIDAESATLVRPILAYTRPQIEDVALKLGLVYRTDASNADWRFTRNRIREGWLKLLNPLEIQTLLREMLELGRVADDVVKLMEESCKKLEKQQVKAINPGKILLDIPRGTGYFSALWKALFDKAFQHVTGIKTGLSERHYRSLKWLLETGQSGQQIRLPNDCSVIRERSRLCFVKAGLDEWQSTVIQSGEDRTISFFQVKLESVRTPETLFTDKRTQYLPDAAEGWLLRPWESGDRIKLFGHSKFAKVSDILQAAKVAPHLKKWWPVMLHGDEIVWIPGIVPSEFARIKANTSSLVRVEIVLNFESAE